MDSVLVTGATGFIGSHLVEVLTGSGHEVVALARSTSDVAALKSVCTEIRYGDIADLRSVVKACSNVDAVVHLAAATSSGNMDHEKSFETNVVGSQNVIDACRVQNVGRVVYVGSQADNSGTYAATKREAERSFVESGLEWVVVKPSLVYGPGQKGVFARMSGFVKRFPFIPIIGKGDQPMRPIYVGDVAWTIRRCLRSDVTRKDYFISGPEVVTYCEFVEKIAEALELRRFKVHIPTWPVHAAILGASLVPGMTLPITTDTLRGLTSPRVHTNELAETELGFAPMPLDEGLRRSVS